MTAAQIQALVERLTLELAAGGGEALFAAGREAAAGAWDAVAAGAAGETAIPGPPRSTSTATLAAVWQLLLEPVARGVAAETADRIAGLESPTVTKSLGVGFLGGAAVGLTIGRLVG